MGMRTRISRKKQVLKWKKKSNQTRYIQFSNQKLSGACQTRFNVVYLMCLRINEINIYTMHVIVFNIHDYSDSLTVWSINNSMDSINATPYYNDSLNIVFHIISVCNHFVQISKKKEISYIYFTIRTFIEGSILWAWFAYYDRLENGKECF